MATPNYSNEAASVDAHISTVSVCVFDDFDAVPSALSDAISYPSIHDFFLSFQWFKGLYETSIEAGQAPRLYFVLRGNRPTAALFCLANTQTRSLTSLTNFYSVAYGPIGFGNLREDSESINSLVNFIAAEVPAWKRIELRFIAGDVATTEALSNALKRTSFSPHAYAMYENWYIATSGTNFETYYGARPSRLRNTVQRKQRKAERSHNLEIKLYGNQADVDDGLQQAIDDYIKVYGESWKINEPYPEFIPQLIRTTAELGVLRLGILYLDDKPVAAQLWITHGQRAMIYKLAYDENFAQNSPGSILSRAMFQQALDEDRVDEIDYGIGSEPYKREWMDTVRPVQGLIAYNRRSIWGLSMAMRQQLSSLLGRLRQHS